MGDTAVDSPVLSLIISSCLWSDCGRGWLAGKPCAQKAFDHRSAAYRWGHNAGFQSLQLTAGVWSNASNHIFILHYMFSLGGISFALFSQSPPRQPRQPTASAVAVGSLPASGSHDDCCLSVRMPVSRQSARHLLPLELSLYLSLSLSLLSIYLL